MSHHGKRVVVIGAGIGGLTTAALLTQAGHAVTVLEAQTYPGGCAATFVHKGYRFDTGATIIGGFQPGGPHRRIADQLGIEFPIRQHDPGWITHLPDCSVPLAQDPTDMIAAFPGAENFWREQRQIADIGWSLSAQGLPFPPADLREFKQLVKVGALNARDAVRDAALRIFQRQAVAQAPRT